MKPLKPWPWNALLNPTPADWGIGMTVCVAAICEDSGNEAIITACDKMVSMGGYVSGDPSVRKIDPILYDWSLMFAASDISPSTPIVKEIRGFNKGSIKTLGEVAAIIREAYKKQRDRQIEDEILQPIGFSSRSFLLDGKNQLSDRVYERTFDRIESYDLGIDLLVQGYDEETKEPHIFGVSNPGKSSFYDKVGFWAIGSGQHQAIASLFATKYNKWESLAECTTKALIAKFMAESSVGVGKETFVLVSRKDVPNRTIFINPPIQQAVRNKYDSLPKIPRDALPEVQAVIDEQTKRLKGEIMPQLASGMSKLKP
jgi:20S proteasome alpha/beta subunit